MICPQRGALGKQLWSAWEGIATFASKWNGFLPRLVVMITGEAIGAAVAETLAPHALTGVDMVLEEHLPLYRQIPLITATTAIPIVLIMNAEKISKTTLSLFALSIPLIFSLVSLKDLENSTAQTAGTIIHFLAGMFASISGGFLGLKLTNSSEQFHEYRVKMVRHALAGQGFETCIAPANMIVFKIGRFIIRSLIQTIAYNGEDLWRSFKLSVRREKTYGVMAPMFTKALYGRFQAIKRQELSDSIVKAILPFFLKGHTSLFSGIFVEPLITKKLEELQNQSGNLINALTRSLIEYTSILQTDDIRKATSTEELVQLLNRAISLNTPSSSFTIEKIGEALIWNETRATNLSELLCAKLQELGFFLLGRPVYNESHFESIKSIIHIHLKPFVKFTVLRFVNLPLADEQLSPIEDIKLTSIVQHILFSTIVEPILPRSLVTSVKKTLDVCRSITVGTIHKLQGFTPRSQVLAPILIDENYTETKSQEAKPVLDQAALLALNQDYFKAPTPPQIDDSDYIVLDKSEIE